MEPKTAQPEALNPTVSYAADTASAAPATGRYSVYIALGDSYSAANGVTNDGTICQRGNGAWPYLLKPNLSLQDPSQQVVSDACSGATTAGILGTEQGMPPQIGVVTSIAPATLESALITITIGGNDIDVATELALCLAEDCSGNESRILANIAATRVKLLDTYNALKQAAPKATIVAVGYPHLVAATATTPCSDEPTLQIELAERAMIRRTIDVMNDTIKAAANDAKIHAVVDEIVVAFEGREACAGTGRDLIHRAETALPLPSVFHQNAAGNQAYADAVLRALSTRVPNPSPVAQPQPASVPIATPAAAAPTPAPAAATPAPAARPASTPVLPATPVRTTTPTPLPASSATPKPTATAKPTVGSTATPGPTAADRDTDADSDNETDSDDETDSDEDSADVDGEEDGSEGDDASGSEDDPLGEDRSGSEDDPLGDDDSASDDDPQEDV